MKEVKGFLTSNGRFFSTKEEAVIEERKATILEDIDERFEYLATPDDVLEYIHEHFTLTPKPLGKYRRWEGNRW